MDGLRQALRSSEAPAPPPQGRQGEGKTLRTGQNPLRQASRAGQEIPRPQDARPEQSPVAETAQKKGARLCGRPLLSLLPATGQGARGWQPCLFSCPLPECGESAPSVRS